VLVQQAGERAGDAQLGEHGPECRVVAGARARRVERARDDRVGREPAAPHRETDPLRRHRVREPRRVSDQQHPLAGERASTWSHRDHEAMALRRPRREPDDPQVLFELAVQVDRAAVRRQHAHREVRRLGEHPGVPVGDDAHIEAGHPGEPVERGVVDAHLVLERGDQVPPVAPPREPRELARGAVRRDHEGRGHGTRVGVEPDVTPLEAHAAHGARRAEHRPSGGGGRREQVVQPVAHGHRHDGGAGRIARGAVVLVRVEQVELGLPAAPLEHPLDLRRQQRRRATDQTAAARLVAGERVALEQRDREPAAGEGERGGRPGGAGADDGDVEHGDH